MDMQTPDGANLNLDALYKIAPSCFTEARGDDGVTRRVVDFGKLRLLLGDNAVEDAPEVYDFTWVGKRAALKEAAAPIRKTLRPCPEESVDWDKTQNLYIEGDNLEVLKLLQNSYMGKVKMIYIDPPYNTGNDFVYRDDFHRTQKEEDEEAGVINEAGERMIKNTESNGKFHSDWCSMIYSRLMVARSFLREDGVVFISIDDNEQRNLKNICDEVFGESNFVACINWRRSGGRQDSKYYAVIHEYILCYARDISRFDAGEEIKNGDVYPKYDEQAGRYYKTQLLRKWGANSLRENRPNLYYSIKAPDGTDVYPIIYEESGGLTEATLNEIQGCWRWGASNLANAMKEGRVEFQKNKWNKWVAYEKIFAPKEGEERTKKYSTWLDDVGNGTATIKDLFKTAVFDYSKSADMIGRFIKMAGVDDKDLVFDFFSGSATTAHAVMKLNKEDGGNRKFIMVQLPEKTVEDSEAYKAGYKNICEIGKERIHRAGRKIKDDSPLTTQDLDTGFRVFKCDSSNYKEVAFAPKDYRQEELDIFVDNIKDDRTDLDLLFDCMLRWGVELSLPLTTKKVAGCTVHNVNDGDLVACFDGDVTAAVIEAIAEMSPLRVVFRDSSFNEAAEKINLFELFKQKCDWTDEEVKNNVRVI